MKKEFEKKYKDAFNKIKEASNILLVTHERPDGDAFSCVCTAIELLEGLGKKYSTFCDGELPGNFNFLPHSEKINFKKDKINFFEYDLILIFDCGSKSRTKLEHEIDNRGKNQFLIEFDHHPGLDNYCDIEIRDAESASTTEVLYYLFKLNKIKINKNIATGILTGILTDTGNFVYPSTSEKTTTIASEMLGHGASYTRITQNTLQNKTLDSMKIWGKALSNLKINNKYNLAFTLLSNDDLKSLEDEEGLESLSGFLSSLYGVKGVIFMREFKKGKIKGSLRSAHPKVDISRLAVALGGGGHAKTSGFSIDGELELKTGRWRIV